MMNDECRDATTQYAVGAHLCVCPFGSVTTLAIPTSRLKTIVRIIIIFRAISIRAHTQVRPYIRHIILILYRSLSIVYC